MIVVVAAVAVVAAVVTAAVPRKSVREEVDQFGESRQALARVVRRTTSTS